MVRIPLTEYGNNEEVLRKIEITRKLTSILTILKIQLKFMRDIMREKRLWNLILFMHIKNKISRG